MDNMDLSVVGARGCAPWECMMASRSGVLYWTSFSTQCTLEDVGRQKMCAVRCATGVGYLYWLPRAVERIL